VLKDFEGKSNKEILKRAHLWWNMSGGIYYRWFWNCLVDIRLKR
jgi:hypothetical protein